VFFTRDWHPPDHVSFVSRGGQWPSHCVQNTKGAAFREPLAVHPASTIVSKGFDRDVEAYSGFQGTDLRNQLTGLGVEEVVIGGLTTDYCVKETAKDALKAGFKVEVLEDCIRAVDANPGDGKKAIEEMKQAGATFSKSADEIRQLAGTQQ